MGIGDPTWDLETLHPTISHLATKLRVSQETVNYLTINKKHNKQTLTCTRHGYMNFSSVFLIGRPLPTPLRALPLGESTFRRAPAGRRTPGCRDVRPARLQVGRHVGSHPVDDFRKASARFEHLANA